MKSSIRLKTKILLFLANKAVVRCVAILPIIVSIVFSIVAMDRFVDKTVDKTVMCNSTAVVFDITVNKRIKSGFTWKVYYLYQVHGLNYVGLDYTTINPNIKVGDKIHIQYSDKTPRYSVTL